MTSSASHVTHNTPAPLTRSERLHYLAIGSVIGTLLNLFFTILLSRQDAGPVLVGAGALLGVVGLYLYVLRK